jgi:acyl carrier protein
MIARTTAVEIVLASLKEVFTQIGTPIPDNLGEQTVLVGSDAVLDSLGVVSLIVEVEQRLEGEHSISVTLANDKAMSARNSPFRTVGVLADHCLATALESGS